MGPLLPVRIREAGTAVVARGNALGGTRTRDLKLNPGRVSRTPQRTELSGYLGEAAAGLQQCHCGAGLGAFEGSQRTASPGTGRISTAAVQPGTSASAASQESSGAASASASAR